MKYTSQNDEHQPVHVQQRSLPLLLRADHLPTMYPVLSAAVHKMKADKEFQKIKTMPAQKPFYQRALVDSQLLLPTFDHRHQGAGAACVPTIYSENQSKEGSQRSLSESKTRLPDGEYRCQPPCPSTRLSPRERRTHSKNPLWSTSI